MYPSKVVFTGAVFVAAANVVLLVFAGSYDVRIGPLHLAAHGLFKPLLYLNAAVLIALLARGARNSAPPNSAPPVKAGAGSPSPLWIAALTAALYVPSIFLVPAADNDWTHRGTTSLLNSFSALLHLFAWKQPDGFYRPLGFLSLRIDSAIFGEHLWGYHFQNLALHAANAVIVARLAARLGLEAGAARWAGLLFGVASVNYEPVMWPGARFDLLAGLFTLLALLAALDYFERPATAQLLRMLAGFVCGVLSKESAYCFPPLFVLLWWRYGPRQARAAPAFASIGAATLLLIGIRFAIFGDPGGYPDRSGLAPHFALSFSTFASFFTRAVPSLPFSLNTSAELATWALGAVALYGACACAHTLSASSDRRRDAFFIAAALASALPVANLVNWIGPAAQNVRFLYLPSVWIALMLAATSRARRWLIALAVANALAATYNMQTFRWIERAPPPSAATPPRTLRAPL